MIRGFVGHHRSNPVHYGILITQLTLRNYDKREFSEAMQELHKNQNYLKCMDSTRNDTPKLRSVHVEIRLITAVDFLLNMQQALALSQYDLSGSSLLCFEMRFDGALRNRL